MWKCSVKFDPSSTALQTLFDPELCVDACASGGVHQAADLGSLEVGLADAIHGYGPCAVQDCCTLC